MIDEGEQLELFEDLPITELPVWKPWTTCEQCEHIVAVQFNNSNLFFCSIQNRHRAQYGRKIKKSEPNCIQFQKATEDTILNVDGYYGGKYGEGIKRRKEQPNDPN